jgi:hypothetical protein
VTPTHRTRRQIDWLPAGYEVLILGHTRHCDWFGEFVLAQPVVAGARAGRVVACHPADLEPIPAKEEPTQ